MENATYIALSRLMAQERAMDVVAGNIANADTPGYKSEHVLFSDWLLRTGASPGSGGEAEIDFTQDRATWRDQTAGSLTHTGDPLDLAIGQRGYFSVKTSDGIRLTRAGRFSLLADGTIADTAGNTLLDAEGSPLVASASDSNLSVAGDGTISSAQRVIGKVGIVDPADPATLSAEGSHLFRADGATRPVTNPGLVQGAIEGSNVSSMLEMTRMLQVSRDFQFMSQFVESEAQRQQSAIDKLSNTASA